MDSLLPTRAKLKWYDQGPTSSAIGTSNSYNRRYRSIAFRVSIDILLRTSLCWVLALPGLTIRIQYGSSCLAVLVRDVLSITCENHFLLAAWYWVYFGEKSNKKMVLMRLTLVAVFTISWIAASWGDYVFRRQTQGGTPSRHIIASGLANPAIYLNVQISNAHLNKIFWSGLYQIICVLLVALALFASWNGKLRRKAWSASCWQDKKDSRNNNDERIFVPFLMNSRVSLSFHLIMLVYLYAWHETWAPLTNLLSAQILSVAWMFPEIGRIATETTTGKIKNISPSLLNKNDTTTNQMIPRVNVIIIVHESLSGGALRTYRGKDAAPWFHATKSQQEFYHFSKARTPAGATTIATPAILTGLMAYDWPGVKIMRRSSMSAEFKLLDYDTSSFVSYGAEWQGTTWKVLTDLFTDNVDVVIDPSITGEPIVNEFGMDDRKTVEYFHKWLQMRGSTPNATDVVRAMKQTNITRHPTLPIRPFFATIVFNNQHIPHLNHETYRGCEDYDACSYEDESTTGYYSSLRTMDESLKALFAALSESEELNNTIIVGAGDHGETPGAFIRLRDINAPIMDVPLWMYIPERIRLARASQNSVKEEIPETSRKPVSFLRKNTNRTVSTLDIVPTLRDMLNFPRLFTDEQEKGCVTGTSLFSEVMAEDRLVIGWGGAPLAGVNLGVFSSSSQALIFSPRDASKSRVANFSKSRVANFKFDEYDFFQYYETSFDDLEVSELQRWEEAIAQQGWLTSDFVKTCMPMLASDSSWHEIYTNSTVP